MEEHRKDARFVEYARLYYEENKTQGEIASIFGVSRSSVSRGLKLAHSIGAVQIRVVDPFSDHSDLAQAIKQRFDIDRVVIAPVRDRSHSVRKREIGRAAAAYLETVLTDGLTIGVTWGTTVAEMTAALQTARELKLRVVQLLGAGGSIVAPAHINEVTRRIAHAFRGDWFLLAAPAVVESSAIREALAREELVSTVLDMGRSADIAVIGVGTPDHHSGAVALGHISEDEMLVIKELGAAGEICYRFFDAQGTPCNSPLDNRIVGISLDELRRIPVKIGLAGGENKVEAIIGALRGGYINVLITDEITARDLLDRSLGLVTDP